MDLIIVGGSPRGSDPCTIDPCTIAVHDAQLISNEAPQTQQPARLLNWKIAAVCAHAEVQVSCENFLWLLRQAPAPHG